ncbi:DUF4124 domain-containing protein [Thiohalobacter thiocyanaticus]|nr:DUF4124 domain-containing protein [Thiohalobacter thiocyanaticus]
MSSPTGGFQQLLAERHETVEALVYRTGHKALNTWAVVLFGLPVALAAAPIYKWEGTDGSTYYSETPPAPHADVDYEVIELSPEAPSQPPAAGGYRAVLDVADSLQAARLERERLRLERERTALEAHKIRQEAAQDTDTQRYAAPRFVLPHQFRPHPGPGMRAPPHPEQPRVHRPPDAAPEPPPRGRAIVGR